MNDKMAKDICEAVSENSPFTADDIYIEWVSFHSFDVILRAVEAASIFGFSTIHQATNFLLSEYIKDQKQV